MGDTSQGGNDADTGTCSVTVELAEGDTIQLQYVAGSDDTPLAGTIRNGFTGYRIPTL